MYRRSLLSDHSYESVVLIPPIYLLGDGTSAGWDNTKALEVVHIGDGGQFAIVEHLTAGKFIKFIADLGAWAPQWELMLPEPAK